MPYRLYALTSAQLKLSSVRFMQQGRLGIPRVIIGGPTGLSGMAEGYVKTGGGEARINGIRMCPGMAELPRA